MNIIYLDRLSFFSIFSIIRSKIDYSNIFYFNASSNSKKFIKIFQNLGMLKVEPVLAEFILGEIRDERGESRFIKIWENLRDICFKISNNEFAANTFLKGISKKFDFRKIVLFFEKILSEQINEKVVFINAAKWHAENKISCNKKSIIFFLEKDLWSDYLSRYMQSLNIKPVEYWTMISSSYLAFFERGKKVLFSKIKSLLNISNTNRSKEITKESISKNTFTVIPACPSTVWCGACRESFSEEGLRTSRNDNLRGFTNDRISNIKEKNAEVVSNTRVPLIAAWYTGKTVTFDLKKRSDFFWFLKSNIPREQVLVYFDRKDIPVTEEMADVLKREEVKFLALSRNATTSKNIPIWNPTAEYKKTRNSFIRLILRTYLLNAVRLKITPFFFIINMFYFARQYAYWHDFFSSNNVKININPADFFKSNIPMILALNDNGGVSISYHWSNLSFSSITISNCSDVMFSFGPTYRWVWEANHSAIDNLIYCGYITDYSFKEVKENSLIIRKQLLDRGVKFILCYFDENSMDDRMAVITNEKSAGIYKYLIEKMLQDETLGLIFKPGYPKTIYQRLSSISDLIDKAKTSGRCIFMDKGSYVTEQYPTEAAQAADLCVGLLLSGTVALESYLSETPTVFLDLEKLYSNHIYQWGKGKVVFDNLDDMFSAINKYRENPESIPGFGDLSSWAKGKDPFKDGNASLRMGQYINWLLEIFNQGKTKEEAIEYANQRYAKLWGEGSVVRWH